MSSCIFCQKEDDVRDRKIYGACEISDGKPCDPCAEYFELEAQIEKTRKTLEQQLGRRREIRENINRVHDAMLIRVPREITAHIFEFAASVDILPDGTTSESLLDGELYAPLPLGKVCGAWRDIAWGMPQLWTFMFARIPYVEDLPLRLDFATQWLSRSGDYLPLSVHFRLKEFFIDDLVSEEFVPFINLLNLYSHRWRDLCGLCPPYLFEHFSAELHGAPVLRKLDISSSYLSDRTVEFDLGCQRLPQPRSVRLSTLLEVAVNIDWSHVTQLDTDCPWGMRLLDSLPRLPNLTILTLSGVDGDIASMHDPVAHLNLQSLNVSCSWVSRPEEQEQICDFLGALIFPYLRHLTIDLNYSINILDTVITLIQRSSCDLTSLSLSKSPSHSETSFLTLLGVANSLEKLAISITDWTDNFIVLEVFLDRIQQHYLSSISQPFPLTRLRCIKYITPFPFNTPWDLLLGIFDPDEFANPPRLRTLSLAHSASSPELQDFIGRHLAKDKIQGILKLINAGIELLCPEKISREYLLELMKS